MKVKIDKDIAECLGSLSRRIDALIESISRIDRRVEDIQSQRVRAALNRNKKHKDWEERLDALEVASMVNSKAIANEPVRHVPRNWGLFNHPAIQGYCDARDGGEFHRTPWGYFPCR